MRCEACGHEHVARHLGVCLSCVRERPEVALPIAQRAHGEYRARVGLPPAPPERGVPCGVCHNECRIPPGETGYCGVHANHDGKLVSLSGLPDEAVVSWYYDTLPTNCVAGWACPNREGKNLAVFYGACNRDCLFCQNAGYHDMTRLLRPVRGAEELASAVDEGTRCVCFFGGDPTPQVAHAIRASTLIGRSDVRVCWETNGSMASRYLREVGRVSRESGGIVKFDLKAWDPALYEALCGVPPKGVYENLEELYGMGVNLAASTLLVPGYVDAVEVESIAGFLASLDPGIPYSLLAFHPQHLMSDLQPTTRGHARRCLAVAREAGLENVRVGNRHLLKEG